MIFKKLTLKNFMSYPNAEIDFSGVHVACLTGVNGAGKSSLLDAITWVLWEGGRARTDELIRLRTVEMSCELEFYMEGDLYRVYRLRSKAFKNSQGKSNLEFQIFNPKEKIWTSLTLSTVRQTQDLIIKTIKMDYETFVNSVYLRQGKADEFTIKKPHERKQVLADILGLDVYNKLCEAARTKVRTLDQGIALEQNLITNLKEKILNEDELKKSLEYIFLELSKEEKELVSIREELNKKEKELSEMREKGKQIKTLEKSKEAQESLINTLREQLNSIKLKEEKYKKLISNKEKIRQEHNNFLELKKEFDKCELGKELYNKLLHEKNYFESELKEKINQIEQELAVHRSKLTDRSSLKDNLMKHLTNESRFISDFLPNTKKEIKEFYDLQEQISKIESKGQELKHKKELLDHKLEEISDKKKEVLKKIETLNSHNHSEPCPLCKSPIKNKDEVIKAYKVELKSYDENEKLVTSDIEVIEKEIQEKRNEYAQIKEKINSTPHFVSKRLKELEEIKQQRLQSINAFKSDPLEALSVLSSHIEVTKNEFQKTQEQIATLDKEINTYKQEAESLDDLLKNGSLIKGLSKKLNDIQNELNKVSYSQSLYEELKSKKIEKENIILTHNLLLEAETEFPDVSRELESLSLKLNKASTELEELKSLIDKNKNQIENIAQLEREVLEIKHKEDKKNLVQQEIKKNLIVTEQSLSEIEHSKKQMSDKENKIQALISDKKYFEILEKAFSKNGIPVAIIETVVPEIEKEANRILTRLTENQMHVALKTQREKKSSSGLTETLDVVIADSFGTRSYELYSGGEAFKIDFALRLALSKLLANRAGAKLQTLIIDEGFGSQDTAGRERLVEVIRSIQDEFELILVVTHLEELKEAFQTQIQVTKDDEGSKIRLI
ncbi:MAG: SMC family ATPase [Candidatus Melainabacteria bacterium]|nr:SMC family ATPase [Candidatus Melainabacteria bacterium]